MANDVYAYAVAVFEYDGDRQNAFDFIDGLFRDDGFATGIEMLEAEVVQWSDPVANQAITEQRNGTAFNKFTVSLQLRFTTDGNYSDCQRWVVDRLMTDEDKTHMFIQLVRLSLARR